MLNKIIGIGLVAWGGLKILKNKISTQQKTIEELSNDIEALKKFYTIVKIKVLSKENNQINLIIAFYNLDGEKIIEKNYNLVGSNFNIDFISVDCPNQTLSFPYKLFTEKIAPDNAINIMEKAEFIYKSNANQSLLMLATLLKEAIKKDVNSISYNVYGIALQPNKAPQKNDIFEIILHPKKGGLELIKH